MTSARKFPWFLAGLVSLVLAVAIQASVGVLLYQTRQSADDYASCSAEWQQQFGGAYRARVAASIEVDVAQDAVFRAVAAEDPAGFQAALDAYIKVRDNQVKERAKNPLPPLPEQLCGDPKEVRR